MREIELESTRASACEKTWNEAGALPVCSAFHLDRSRSRPDFSDAPLRCCRQREMPRHQKQSSEAIMSFRMQNSSFRLAALGTFTFKCKLAECAPQSRLAVSSFPFWGGSIQPLAALSYRPYLHFRHLFPASYVLLPAEDVGDMAEAPGFNILHLKCSARAREKCKTARQPPFYSLPLLPPLLLPAFSFPSPAQPSTTTPPFSTDWI